MGEKRKTGKTTRPCTGNGPSRWESALLRTGESTCTVSRLSSGPTSCPCADSVVFRPKRWCDCRKREHVSACEIAMAREVGAQTCGA
eukprot:2882972-Rhodomonas_salina.1